MKPERLDKVLAAQSTISRKDVKALVRAGKVLVNGKMARSPDMKIDMERDKVSVGGEEVALARHIYLMLNKPAGVVSATRDGEEKTVIDLVPEALMRDGLFPAGRLDKNTTGFVLITDDGDFAHRILSPKNHIPKTYIAELDGPVDDKIIAEFEAGFALSRQTLCKPASLRVLETGERERVEVVITEGMYHQIKRMFEHFGRTVVELRRIRMGRLFLDEKLAAGECRELTTEELQEIAASINE